MSSEQDLDDDIEADGGVVGKKRLANLTGIPGDFILEYARTNDIPTIAGGYAFTADTAADVVDAYEELCDEEGDLDEEDPDEDEDGEDEGCDLDVDLDCRDR